MFKFIVLFAVVAAAAAKPGFLAAPALTYAPAFETRTAIIGEKTIESHGNSVVHAAAPVVTGYAAPAIATYAAAPAIATYAAQALPALRTSLIAEKTIESHGNAVVHGAAPVITGYAAPAIAAPAFAAYAAPAYL